MFESLYGSPWHHPYFFWAFGGPLLGLFAWRALTSEAPRARALAALLAAFQLGILADAWLNAPKLSPLSGGTAEAVAIAFVILGDARFFLLLERFGRGQTRLRASVYALGWSLLVPVGSLLAKSFSSNGRVHYLTYELAFAALIIGLRKVSLKIPGALIAVLVGTVIVTLLGVSDASIPTIGSKFKEISAQFRLTDWSSALPDRAAWLAKVWAVLPLAFGIALLVGIESLLCAVVADGMTGDRHDSDTELAAQGVANIASACFMGLPVTGVIARTSTNARAGAKTPVSGLIHAVTVLAILLILAPLVKLIPLASLAGVLLSVCWYMAELPLWPRLFRSGGSDMVLMVLACLITVFVDLIWAVGLGVVVAFIFLLIRKSSHPEKQEPETIDVVERDAEVRLSLSGHLHFGRAAEPRAVEARLKTGTLHLTLDFSHALFVDCSYAQALRELATHAHQQGVTVRAVGLQGRSATDFARFGLREVIAI